MVDGSATRLLDMSKPLALLIYLACSPGRAARREKLQDLIWADLEPEAGRHAVRQTLWYIKQKVRQPIIEVSGDSLTLHAGVRVDRDLVVAASQAGDLERVVSAYRGDFVPGFAAPGGAEFERWAEVERAYLRSLFIRAAEALVRQWLSAGKARDAVLLARRLRDLTPDSEAAWRLVLESNYAAGDTLGAAAEADALERRFTEEERPPEPATAATLRLVRKSPAVTKTDSAVVLPLVGREREFKAIVDAWERSRAGTSTHIHLSAPAGLGKSRLLGDVHSRLRLLRARVIHVRGSIGQRDVPYALASEIAAAAAELPGARGISSGSASALIAINPTLSSQFAGQPDSAIGSEALRRRGLALCELLDVVSQEQPIALLIDDTHWADEMSRVMIQAALDAIGRLRVLLVTASRPGSGRDPSAAGSHLLVLEPLSPDHVAELLADLAALPGDRWAADLPRLLHDATRGTPLLLLETIRLLSDRAILTVHDGAWRCSSPDALAETVRGGAAVQRRLGTLSPDERAVMQVLGVAGTPITGRALDASLPATLHDLTRTLQSLEQQGFVSRVGEEWRASHDEIAAVAVESLAPEQHDATLARLAHALLVTEPEREDQLRRAVRYAVDGGDSSVATRAFLRLVHAERARGNRLGNADLARDLVGPTRDAADIRHLMRALPLTHRVGLFTRGRRVAATGALVAVASVGGLALMALVTEPPPHAELAVFVESNDTLKLGYRVAIRASEWVPGEPIVVRRSRRPDWQIPGLLTSPPSMRPGTNRWYYVGPVPDTGDTDLFSVGEDGLPRRETFAPNDEYLPSFSPDGYYAVMATARWDSLFRPDIGLLEVDSGTFTQVTSGHGGEHSAVWSPDGTRFAWIQYAVHFDSDLDSGVVCVRPRARSSRSCWPLAGLSRRGVMPGWLDAQHVLVATVENFPMRLWSLNVDAGTARQIGLATSHQINLSPDGRWMACTCVHDNYPANTWLIVPTGDLNRARPLRMELSTGEVMHLAWTRAGAPAYLDSLRVSSTGTVQRGVPHRLAATAFNSRGDTVATPTVEWAVDSASVARIDSVTGMLLATDTGRVVITMSVGGWPYGRDTVTIRERVDSALLEERWRTTLGDRWWAYGTPSPVLGNDSTHERVYMPNGDGSFDSGVFSRDTFPSGDGLAVDAHVSTPVTETQHQAVAIAISSTRRLDEYAHQAVELGALPDLPQWCSLRYPGSEGVEGPRLLSLTSMAANQRAVAPASQDLATGQWYRIRVQLFPDGRCGLAVNGRAVAVTSSTQGPRGAVRVRMNGASKNTAIRVGPVTLRRGVPADIDWTVLDSARAPGAERKRP